MDQSYSKTKCVLLTNALFYAHIHCIQAQIFATFTETPLWSLASDFVPNSRQEVEEKISRTLTTNRKKKKLVQKRFKQHNFITQTTSKPSTAYRPTPLTRKKNHVCLHSTIQPVARIDAPPLNPCESISPRPASPLVCAHHSPSRLA